MSKPQLDLQIAKNAATGVMGKVRGFRHITEGEESQAYAFLSGGEHYILRVNREVVGFAKDAFAYRNFGQSGVPIPEVVHIGRIDEEHFFCISRRLGGVTLQDLSVQELPGVLGATAEVLDLIAASNISGISGCGPFDANAVGRYASWREFLLSDANEGPYFAHLVSHCPEVRCLVHGDFGSNNVLTDGQRITGVLDWSEAMVGDPLYDIANVFFWRGLLPCMEQQARYFEKRLEGIPHWRERMLCYQRRIALKEHPRGGMTGNAL